MKSEHANPDDYVAALDGWRRDLVTRLRKAVLATRGFEEAIRYGHLVYSFDGPALLIRAEPERVLFGFWRGQRLLELEPRLKPGGKYEMATLELREGDALTATAARRLAKEALALNAELGDPRMDAKPMIGSSAKTKRAAKKKAATKTKRAAKKRSAKKAQKRAKKAQERAKREPGSR